jgi:hypothetical protein
MDFSDALNAMKSGSQVRRAGWGAPPGSPANTGNRMEITPVFVEGQTIDSMLIRRVDGSLVPFGGSQWDILSDDWEIVNDA